MNSNQMLKTQKLRPTRPDPPLDDAVCAPDGILIQ